MVTESVPLAGVPLRVLPGMRWSAMDMEQPMMAAEVWLWALSRAGESILVQAILTWILCGLICQPKLWPPPAAGLIRPVW